MAPRILPAPPFCVGPSITSITLEAPKVPTSSSPYGTVAGVQFAALLQWLLTGLRFHVALPAYAPWTAMVRATVTANRLMPECILASIRAESWQTCLCLQKGDHVVCHSMLGIARKMVPRTPIMKGVQVSGDSEILIIGA